MYARGVQRGWRFTVFLHTLFLILSPTLVGRKQVKLTGYKGTGYVRPHPQRHSTRLQQRANRTPCDGRSCDPADKAISCDQQWKWKKRPVHCWVVHTHTEWPHDCRAVRRYPCDGKLLHTFVTCTLLVSRWPMGCRYHSNLTQLPQSSQCANVASICGNEDGVNRFLLSCTQRVLTSDIETETRPTSPKGVWMCPWEVTEWNQIKWTVCQSPSVFIQQYYSETMSRN